MCLTCIWVLFVFIWAMRNRSAELQYFHDVLIKLLKLFMSILTQKMTLYLIIILFNNNKTIHFQSNTLDNSLYFFNLIIFIGKLNIFPLILLLVILSVSTYSDYDTWKHRVSDFTLWHLISIKTITSVLKVLNFIITSITARPNGLTAHDTSDNVNLDL